MDPYQKAKRGFQVFINAFTSGSWTLAESDPVWSVLFRFWGGRDVFELMMELFLCTQVAECCRDWYFHRGVFFFSSSLNH